MTATINPWAFLIILVVGGIIGLAAGLLIGLCKMAGQKAHPMEDDWRQEP